MEQCDNFVALATYNGLHFVTFIDNLVTKMQTVLFEGQFCNKIMKFGTKLMVTIWGNQNFHVVDLRSMQICYQIFHPIQNFDQNPKNWGLKPFLYKKQKLQYALSRDNEGFCLIDIRNKKAY